MLKLQFKDQRADPVWIVDKTFSIGCDDDNQLVINDSSVSRQHARISYSDGNYTLRDLGSSEGVFVNNRRINKKPINSGDKIRIGKIDLLVTDPVVEGKQNTWSLVACSSWLSGQEFVIPAKAKNAPIKVGRSSHCDIIFPGTHLSREHIELRINGDHVEVRDLGSANGTFINDHQISEGKLYPGDSIRLDVYSFKLLGPGMLDQQSSHLIGGERTREIEPKPSIAQQLNLLPRRQNQALQRSELPEIGSEVLEDDLPDWELLAQLESTAQETSHNFDDPFSEEKSEEKSASTVKAERSTSRITARAINENRPPKGEDKREKIEQIVIAGVLGGAVLGLGLYLAIG